MPTLRLAALGLAVALLPGCELIANFDRDDIPEPGFMLPDAGPLPSDGSVTDGSLPNRDGGKDAGEDAGSDAGPDMDASGDAGELDASPDMDAMVDSGDETDGGM